MNVSLVTLGDPDSLTGGYLYHRRMAEAARKHDAELTFVSFPDRAFPFPALRGRKVAERACLADVVVLDSIAACYAPRRFRHLRARMPVVAMLHQPPGGIDHSGPRRLITALLDAAAYRNVDRLLVASESLKTDMKARGFVGDQIIVVPPGRDVSSAAVARTDLRKSRRIAALCIGNWIPRKGILDALEAVAALPAAYITLHLVGDERRDSRYGRRVAARIEQRDLKGRVVRHGPLSRDAVSALYRGADVFVLPSLVEPYGTVLGEAMAEGLPVVGYDAGNLPHLAVHNREAFLAAPRDVQSLARYIGDLAESEQLRLAVGRAARRRALGFPTWEATATLFFGALREVLEGRSPRL